MKNSRKKSENDQSVPGTGLLRRTVFLKIIDIAENDEYSAVALLLAARTDGYLYVNMLRQIFPYANRNLLIYRVQKLLRHGILREVDERELKEARADPESSLSKLERVITRYHKNIKRYQLERIRWYRLTESAREATRLLQSELLRVLSPDTAKRCIEYRKALTRRLAFESERIRKRLREIYRESVERLFWYRQELGNEEFKNRVVPEAEMLRKLGVEVTPAHLKETVETLLLAWKCDDANRRYVENYYQAFEEFMERALPQSLPGEKKILRVEKQRA